jgi:TP901 family phage tail tape measure protein
VAIDVVSLVIKNAFEGAKAYAEAGDALQRLARDVTVADKAVKQLNGQARDLRSFKSLSSELATADAKTAALKDEMEKLSAQIKATDAPSSRLVATYDRVANAYEKASKSARTKEERLKALSSSLNKAGVDTSNLVSAEIKLSAAQLKAADEAAKLKSSFDAQALSASKLEQIDNALQKKLNELGNLSLVTQSMDGLSTALGGLGLGLSDTGEKATSFEKSMAEVSTLLSDTSDLDYLAESVRKLNQQFGGGAPEQANALYQIISAGATSSAAAVDVLTESNRLALGGVTEVTVAADGLTSILNAYSAQNLKAADVSDKLFVAMKAGKTTIGELSSSVGQVATLASTAGVSLGEMLAATAAITKGGVTTSEAMTQLRGILTAVVKGAGEATAVSNELGLQFNIAALRSKGLAGFLQDVKEKTQGNTEVMGSLFGRVEALNGALALTGNQADSFNEILGQMEQSAGATSVAVEKMEATRAHAFAQAQASIEELQISLGSILSPLITAATQGVTYFATEHRSLAVAVSGTVAVVGVLATSISLATKAYVVISTAIAYAQAGLARYRVETVATTVTTDGLTASTVAASTAMKALGVAVKAVGFIAVAYAAYELGSALRSLWEEEDAGEAATKSLEEGQDKLAKKFDEISKKTGVTVKSMEDLHKAVDSGKIKFDEATKSWVKAEEALDKTRQTVVVTADELVTKFNEIKTAISQNITTIGRQIEVQKAQAQAALKGVEAQAALNAILGDSVRQNELAAESSRISADLKLQEAESSEKLYNARVEELEALRQLIAERPALAATRRNEIEALETEVERRKAATDAAYSEAEAAEAVAAKARLATLTHGDQSESLLQLEAAAGRATTRVRELEQAHVDGIDAQQRLIVVEEDLIVKQQALNKAMEEGGDVSDIINSINDLIKTRDSLNAIVDKGREAVKDLSKARADEAVKIAQVKDALDDALRRRKAEEEYVSRETGLIQTAVNARSTLVKNLIEEAKARGDLGEVKRLEKQLVKDEVEGLVAVAEARQREYEAALESANALLEKVQNTEDATDADWDSVDAANAAAEAKKASAEASLEAAIHAQTMAVETEKANKAMEEEAAKAKKAADSEKEAAEAAKKLEEAAKGSAIAIGQTSVSLEYLGDYADYAREKFQELLKATADEAPPMAFAGAWKIYVEGLARAAEEYARNIRLTDEFNAALAGLTSQYEGGELSVQQYTERLNDLGIKFHGLGAEKLLPLRNALDDIKGTLDDILDTSLDALSSAYDAANSELEGVQRIQNELRKEEIEWEQKRKELQDKLEEARKAGLTEAVRNYEEAIRLEEEAHNARIRHLQEELDGEKEITDERGKRNKAPSDNNPPEFGPLPVNPPKPGGGPGGNNSQFSTSTNSNVPSSGTNAEDGIIGMRILDAHAIKLLTDKKEIRLFTFDDVQQIFEILEENGKSFVNNDE